MIGPYICGVIPKRMKESDRYLLHRKCVFFLLSMGRNAWKGVKQGDRWRGALVCERERAAVPGSPRIAVHIAAAAAVVASDRPLPVSPVRNRMRLAPTLRNGRMVIRRRRVLRMGKDSGGMGTRQAECGHAVCRPVRCLTFVRSLFLFCAFLFLFFFAVRCTQPLSHGCARSSA